MLNLSAHPTRLLDAAQVIQAGCQALTRLAHRGPAPVSLGLTKALLVHEGLVRVKQLELLTPASGFLCAPLTARMTKRAKVIIFEGPWGSNAAGCATQAAC